jgi:flagellar hook-length control protein FliK
MTVPVPVVIERKPVAAMKERQSRAADHTRSKFKQFLAAADQQQTSTKPGKKSEDLKTNGATDAAADAPTGQENQPAADNTAIKSAPQSPAEEGENTTPAIDVAELAPSQPETVAMIMTPITAPVVPLSPTQPEAAVGEIMTGVTAQPLSAVPVADNPPPQINAVIVDTADISQTTVSKGEPSTKPEGSTNNTIPNQIQGTVMADADAESPGKPGSSQPADYTALAVKPATGETKPDIKQIIAMESQIHPVKVESEKSAGSQMDNQNQPGQDTAKFNLLLNQTEAKPTQLLKPMELPREQIEPKQLMQQIVQQADILLKSDLSEIKMQLKPDFLGKMLIKVTVEDGVVTAKFITENQHVKQMLEANLTSLRQSLEASGMKVEKAEVNVQLANDSGGNYNGSDNRYPNWSEQQHKEFTKASNHSDYMEQQDLDYLFKLIRKNIQRWWD